MSHMTHSDGDADADLQMTPPRCTLVSATAANQKGPLDVVWTVTPPADDDVVWYLAASPCTRGCSYDGSCLPFASEAQATDRTPSRGTARIEADGTYRARLAGVPNAYYTGLGTDLVPPSMRIAYRSGGRDVRTSLILGSAPHPSGGALQ